MGGGGGKLRDPIKNKIQSNLFVKFSIILLLLLLIFY